MRRGPTRDEIVTLFTVSGLKAARIAERFGVTRAWVYMELKAGGVGPLRPEPKVKPVRVIEQSLVRGCERFEKREAAQLGVLAPRDPQARKNPDLFHCLGVVRGNGGRGFSFGVEA